MKTKTRIFLLTVALIAVTITLYFLSHAFFEHARSLLWFWYSGYEKIEEAYVLAGVSYGMIIGFLVSFLLWLLVQIRKRKGEKHDAYA